MESQKVDMFMMANAKFFEGHQLNTIRERLLQMDDDKWVVGDGLLSTDDARWTMDGGGWAKDEGRWTRDDGGQGPGTKGQ